MKRILLKLLILTTILTTITSCSRDVEDIITNDSKEITIIMSEHWDTMGTEGTRDAAGYRVHLSLFMEKFTQDTGVEVTFIQSMANSHNEYLEKRNTELYLEDGPTLILIGGDEYYDNLVEQGVAIKVEDKLSNYENIYDGIKDGYFVPIAMATRIIPLNNVRLNELGLNVPDLNWDIDEYYKVNDKYFKDSKEQLSAQNVHKILYREIERMVGNLDRSQKITMATEDTVERIEDIYDYFFSSGNFLVNDDYIYENYYNMLFDYQSDEYKESYSLWEQTRKADPELRLLGSVNALNAIETNNNYNKYLRSRDILTQGIEEEDIALLPPPDDELYSWGFIVNKNGKNTEEGLLFLDMLLEDESQLNLYTQRDDEFNPHRALSFGAPVVKTIEEEIGRIGKEKTIDKRFVNIRNTILQQIKEGKKKRISWSPEDYHFKGELKKLIINIVFADEKYTSEEIMNKLKQFDNEMNLMFKE